MASTPTPPQCSTISAGKPSQNHQCQQNQQHRHQHHQHHLKNRRQNNSRWGSNRYSLSKPSPLPATSNATPAPPCFSSIPSLPSPQSQLGADFSGRRSTRLVSKLHTGRPRAGSSSAPHSPVAEEALQQLLQCGNDATVLEGLFLNFELRLCGTDDYMFLIRELGNMGECSKVTRFYDFALRREKRRYDQGRLTSTMISALGRLERVDLAERVFEKAKNEGYGNTVYSISALISAYGRNGRYNEAIAVFQSMKNAGFRPNLVTYNAVIDASGKGGVEYTRVKEVFYEMLDRGVQPDRITYNSLLAVCSKWGMWEEARKLFSEMVEIGIDQDIFTYNTLLDALCKGGQIDLATEVMADMPAKKIFPNLVTYSTMIDGYAKAGRLEEALNLFNETKYMPIGLDRILYNTLIAIYTRVGRFEEALSVFKEMESYGITKDAATYNSLLDGYGKQGKFDEVRRLFEEMKAENVYPTVLTYSIMMDVYSKGGRYREAMDAFRELMKTGSKTDVVLFSALIDALCKKGLVESAVMLLDEMTGCGVRPNVVTYNSIINAFGRSAALEYGADTSLQANEHRIEPSSSTLIAGPFQNQVEDKLEEQITKLFGQLAAEKAGHSKKGNGGRQDTSCILWLFRKMHETEIKPNVVTFSAILNACSRCNSFEDASMLLEELRMFDNNVYGVAHGLLMGYRENIWVQALSLFDEVKQMDFATASAFYNALTDMLWHFGQKRGTQLVVLEGKRRNVWDGVWSQSCLDLHLMSCGAACAMVHAWLLNIHSVVFDGCQLPRMLSILTGWGKHSKVVGDGNLRRAIEALLNGMGAPFRIAECNLGRFISPGSVVTAWLREPSTLNVLVLHDRISNTGRARSGQMYNLGALGL